MMGRERRHVFDYFKAPEPIQGPRAEEHSAQSNRSTRKKGERGKSVHKKSEPRIKRPDRSNPKKADPHD
jgi:hypothetical protein